MRLGGTEPRHFIAEFLKFRLLIVFCNHRINAEKVEYYALKRSFKSPFKVIK